MAKRESITAGAANDLRLPSGCALVQRKAGVNGVHPFLGDVVLGWIYTVSKAMWLKMRAHTPDEFEPARPEDAETIRLWESPPDSQ